MTVAGIVLAAGASSRMGSPKALLQWGDTTLVQHAIDVLTRADVEPVAVVIGRHAQAIRAAVGDYDRLVFNARWGSGRATSLARGAWALRRAAPDAIVIQNVDQPTTVEVVRALIEALETSGADAVQPVYRDAGGTEHGGHPVVLRGTLLPALLEASEATDGLRGVLAGRRVERIALDDPTVRIDLDTPEAYEAARAELGALPGSTCGGRGRS